MKNTKKTKKPTYGKKIFLTILALVLAGVIGVSIAFNVVMYQKIKDFPTTPGVSDEVEQPPLDESNVIVTPITPPIQDEAQPKLMMTARTASLSLDNSEIDVQITVTPDVELPGTLIDWTISFANANSEWAQDKVVTDYATITPDEDGALSANLSIVQAFGEQIMVTTTLRTDSNVSAVCTVDYAKKFHISDIAVSALSADTVNEYMSLVTPVTTTSVGTVDDPITCTGYLKPTQRFIDFISSVAGVSNGLVSEDYIAYINGAQLNADSESYAITANRLAFIKADSSLRERVVATFAGYATETQHMYRLLGYGYAQANADAEWSEYMSAINAFDKSTVLNANLAINNYVKAQEQAGNLVAMDNGAYAISEAFEIVYEYSGEYNKATTCRKTIPFVFNLLPASVTSLTINPGHIII